MLLTAALNNGTGSKFLFLYFCFRNFNWIEDFMEVKVYKTIAKTVMNENISKVVSLWAFITGLF